MKKNLLIIAILPLLTVTAAIAQDIDDRRLIISQTNVEALNKIAKKATKHYLSSLHKIGVENIEPTIVNSNNEIGYLSGFDAKGNPVYDFEDNINAAITSRTNKIWTGGTSGLDLNGDEIEIGHWEASGLALPTHQELDGKITHAENEDVTGHATHTAGTMVSTGINPNARGMASSASIVSRRSNNDESELAIFGAAGGILSNHSYSTGNPSGDIPLYGAYTANSAEWDEIMYNAPYLTMCKSAGNNRNDNVNTPDLGYDLIYTVAASKNLITVGAVDDVIEYTGPASVVQSEFSNWGPTDDWRIKPDITTNGIDVFSSDDDNDTAYRTRNGTSMSTPTTTGSIALLQQHYHNLNDVYMKSATVRSLLICTTDEVGDNDGPDFQSGWGLLNAERAAEVISNNGTTSFIDELSLANNGTYTTEIEVDGTSPLQLTIAWTDPAGNPVSGEDNQTSILINDLDVRISGNGSTFEPWTFTPNASSDNFTDAATKGDNFRDNVERIDVSNIPAGTYTVTVTHKGSLVNNEQDFSIAINGISVPLAVNDIKGNDSIVVYPVPLSSGKLYIRIPNEYTSKEYNIQIFNMLGKNIKKSTHSENNIEMDVKGLSPGTYLLKIQGDSNTFQKKLIIQ